MLRAPRLNPLRNPDCCAAYTPYPNRFTEITGHHPDCPSFLYTAAGRAESDAVWARIEREREELYKKQAVESAREDVATLESLVAGIQRQMAIPRGGANLSHYNATMAKFQAQLDEALRGLGKAKAHLASLLSS